MKQTRMRIVGGASLAGFAAVVTLALVPAAHAAATVETHSSGANMSMADGSVRLVSSAIDVNTWQALGSRNGGEVFSDSL